MEISGNVDAIIYSNNDPLALSTIATIAKQSADLGRMPIIYDLKAVLYGVPDTFAPSILKIVKKKTSEHIFRNWISQQNYEVRKIDCTARFAIIAGRSNHQVLADASGFPAVFGKFVSDFGVATPESINSLNSWTSSSGTRNGTT